MKNIWRDYWKGQTYNASALPGCCYPKHPDVVRTKIYTFAYL